MTWPVEKMYDWAAGIRGYSILLILEHVAVYLRACTPVKIYDLDCESDWLEQDIDQEHYAEMVNLLVWGLEPLFAVPIYPKLALYKVLINGWAALQPRACQQS